MHGRGNGKLRHVRIGVLRTQERDAKGELDNTKTLDNDNPAYATKKHLTYKKIAGLMDKNYKERRMGKNDMNLRI